jgi:hypothetical protein
LAQLRAEGVEPLPFPKYYTHPSYALEKFDKARIHEILGFSENLTSKQLSIAVKLWILGLIAQANIIIDEWELHNFDYAKVYAKPIASLTENEELRLKFDSLSEEELHQFLLEHFKKDGDPLENLDLMNAYMTIKKALWASDLYRIGMDAINLGHELFELIDSEPLEAMLLSLELSSRIHRLTLEHLRRIVEIGDQTTTNLNHGRAKAQNGSEREIDDRHFEWQKALNLLMRNDPSLSYRQASIAVAKTYGVTDRNIRRYTKPIKPN